MPESDLPLVISEATALGKHYARCAGEQTKLLVVSSDRIIERCSGILTALTCARENGAYVPEDAINCQHAVDIALLRHATTVLHKLWRVLRHPVPDLWEVFDKQARECLGLLYRMDGPRDAQYKSVVSGLEEQHARYRSMVNAKPKDPA